MDNFVKYSLTVTRLKISRLIDLNQVWLSRSDEHTIMQRPFKRLVNSFLLWITWQILYFIEHALEGHEQIRTNLNVIIAIKQFINLIDWQLSVIWCTTISCHEIIPQNHIGVKNQRVIHIWIPYPPMIYPRFISLFMEAHMLMSCISTPPPFTTFTTIELRVF